MREYKIVEAKTPADLEKEIKRHMTREWTLHGTIVVIGDKICHAMYK
jgi:hypothetical protein